LLNKIGENTIYQIKFLAGQTLIINHNKKWKNTTRNAKRIPNRLQSGLKATESVKASLESKTKQK
jgi:hypothetical protein